jgi:hypothetical protein
VSGFLLVLSVLHPTTSKQQPRGPRRGRPVSRARSSGALGASMQREGAVPVGFVQNKMTHTKHLDLLARRGGKWCLSFAVRLRRSSFQHHPIATDSPTTDILACFFGSVRIRPFCGAGPASPACFVRPAGRPPCPTAPFSTYCHCHLLLAHHHPSRPPRTA